MMFCLGLSIYIAANTILYGKPIRQRAQELIKIAHPKFRDELTFEAQKLGYI